MSTATSRSTFNCLTAPPSIFSRCFDNEGEGASHPFALAQHHEDGDEQERGGERGEVCEPPHGDVRAPSAGDGAPDLAQPARTVSRHSRVLCARTAGAPLGL